jgi:hypothetical protein
MPMTFNDSVDVLIAMVLLATFVLVLPVLHHLYIGWAAKRADIMDALSPESRLRYFEMFDRTQTLTEETANQAMNDFYIRWYGRWRYAPTVLLLVAVTLVTNYLAISSALALYAKGFEGFQWIPIQPLGIAAMSGAYMWVVNDFTWRARRLDLQPSDVHWAVLRLAIALPLGCFISQITPGKSEHWRFFVAFSIGAFPLSALLSIFRRLFLKRFGLKDNLSTDNDIIKLQGINAEIAERLANEDITTITQMAYCDPIRIAMRSSLAFNFITDCMSQALAWGYLEKRMNPIRCFGLRGAVEINHLYTMLNGHDPEKKKSATEVLTCVSNTLKQEKATLLMAFYEIAKDPFTEYLTSIVQSPKGVRQKTPHLWQRASRKKLARQMKNLEQDSTGRPFQNWRD